jgi:hypothetical protein
MEDSDDRTAKEERKLRYRRREIYKKNVNKHNSKNKWKEVGIQIL